MKDVVCSTPGCWIRIKEYERLCLACQLDRDLPIGNVIPRRSVGRPPGTSTPRSVEGLSSRCITRNHKQCSACQCECHQQNRGAAA